MHLHTMLRLHCQFFNIACRITVASWSNRIFQLSWRIAAILLISTYAGCLVAALMTEHAHLPFTDLKGLASAVDRNEYKICVANNSAFYSAIMVGKKHSSYMYFMCKINFLDV